MIVPCWYSAPFWPILYPNGVIPAKFIREVMELPQQEGLFLPQHSGAVLFKGVLNTRVVALRLDFRYADDHNS